MFKFFSEAVGSYAENQRITAVRKVYQRGIVNPMLNIELLWKDYCNFESVNLFYFQFFYLLYADLSVFEFISILIKRSYVYFEII